MGNMPFVASLHVGIKMPLEPLRVPFAFDYPITAPILVANFSVYI
jgi:hypothetical protein